MFSFFYLKEQETGKMPENSRTTVDDGVMVQNISPSTSLPNEGMSEPYMAINTFSQLFMIIFQSNRLFLQSQMSEPYMSETYMSEPFILQGTITDDVIAEFQQYGYLQQAKCLLPPETEIVLEQLLYLWLKYKVEGIVKFI